MKPQISLTKAVPVNIGHAWEYYFNQINAWFTPYFCTSPQTRRFMFETYIGGRVYEDFGEGDGVLWGTVIGADYHRSIDVAGYLTPLFGGPAATFERWEMESTETGTTLTYKMSLLGTVEDSTISSLEKGWQEILSKYYDYCLQRASE